MAEKTELTMEDMLSTLDPEVKEEFKMFATAVVMVIDREIEQACAEVMRSKCRACVSLAISFILPEFLDQHDIETMGADPEGFWQKLGSWSKESARNFLLMPCTGDLEEDNAETVH